jgi:hypothetical protein
MVSTRAFGLSLVEAAAELYRSIRTPDGKGAWCTGSATAFAKVPRIEISEVAVMLTAIPTSEGRAAAEVTAEWLRAALGVKLSRFGEWIAATVGETPTYHTIPAKHCRKIHTQKRFRTAAATRAGWTCLLLARVR